MCRFHLVALVSSSLILVAAESATSALTVADFEGYPAFLSPGSAIPGIVVSLEGGIIDEASVELVTGLSFPPGTVATSGTNLLANLYGPTLTITFTTPVTRVSVHTVGSLSGASFGTITMAAFDGLSLVGSISSDPLLIGDSGAPEDFLSLGPLSAITSVVFSSDIGGASTILLDDLIFTPIPPAVPSISTSGLAITSALLVLSGLAVVRRNQRSLQSRAA